MEHHGGPQPAEWGAIAVMPLNGSGSPIDLTAPGIHRDWRPRPSPDGTRILFQRDEFGHRGALTEQILVVDVATGAEERIMSIRAGDRQNNPNGFTQLGHAEWTPDGQSIVFAANRPSQVTFSIWRMDADGTNQVPLTAGFILSIDPSVCPDGRILFVRGITQAGYEPWIMNADGSGAVPIADDTEKGRPEESDYDPYCSPDGTKVVDLRHAGATTWDNVVQSIDGSGWTVVADGSLDGKLRRRPLGHRHPLGHQQRWNLRGGPGHHRPERGAHRDRSAPRLRQRRPVSRPGTVPRPDAGVVVVGRSA